MSIDNLAFVVAGYVICLGALALYVASLARRRRDGE